jgi:hypothetical protein
LLFKGNFIDIDVRGKVVEWKVDLMGEEVRMFWKLGGCISYRFIDALELFSSKINELIRLLLNIFYIYE